jgi:(R,R)-butanediol dehydrogenase / meso-butanediol dehydrogenase / diacetyl reductase
VTKGLYYEGPWRFTVGESPAVPPGYGEVRLDVAYCGICGTDLHIAEGDMDHRVRPPQVIGHEMSGTVAEVGDGAHGYTVGDLVVVRPLDSRGETAADKGFSHISRSLKFLGVDAPGACQSSWTVPAFTVHRLPDGTDLKLAALAEPLAVACHDVRRGEVAAGETVVILGAGPIGLLIALVARARGARVISSEVNPQRLAVAAGLGFDVVDAAKQDLAAYVARATDDRGADVVFEVSGSAAAALSMTEVAGLRGRLVVVAIYPQPQPLRLLDFFLKELQLRGARVYEPEDYDSAIGIISEGSLPLHQLISSVEPLDRAPSLFEEMKGGLSGLKILVDCRS